MNIKKIYFLLFFLNSCVALKNIDLNKLTCGYFIIDKFEAESNLTSFKNEEFRNLFRRTANNEFSKYFYNKANVCYIDISIVTDSSNVIYRENGEIGKRNLITTVEYIMKNEEKTIKESEVTTFSSSDQSLYIYSKNSKIKMEEETSINNIVEALVNDMFRNLI